MNRHEASKLIALEHAAFAAARQSDLRERAWIALEREHILGQSFFWPHLRSHVRMLSYAFETRDWKEVAGQVLRLVLAPLGNLTGKLPMGNTGRANVSAFAPMAYPDDLAQIVSNASQEDDR